MHARLSVGHHFHVFKNTVFAVIYRNSSLWGEEESNDCKGTRGGPSRGPGMFRYRTSDLIKWTLGSIFNYLLNRMNVSFLQACF